MSGTLQGRRALVLYGSETGNAQDVAEELGRIAERLRFDAEVAELNAISLVCQVHSTPGAAVLTMAAEATAPT
jgi:sulfite reductase alpha subunit-like flavoprotein